MSRARVILMVACLLGVLSAGVARADILIHLSDWIAHPIQQDEDKIYTFGDTDLDEAVSNSDPLIVFETLNQVGGDIHTVKIEWNGGAAPLSDAGTFFLDYTVAVDLTLAPGFVIDSVRLDSNTSADNTEVKKDVRDAAGVLLTSLTSTNGSQEGPNVIPDQTLLNIHETFTLDADGILEATTDVYTQRAPIPEPATLIVWSVLGALGLVIAWRRRK